MRPQYGVSHGMASPRASSPQPTLKSLKEPAVQSGTFSTPCQKLHLSQSSSQLGAPLCSPRLGRLLCFKRAALPSSLSLGWLAGLGSSLFRDVLRRSFCNVLTIVGSRAVGFPLPLMIPANSSKGKLIVISVKNLEDLRCRCHMAGKHLATLTAGPSQKPFLRMLPQQMASDVWTESLMWHLAVWSSKETPQCCSALQATSQVYAYAGKQTGEPSQARKQKSELQAHRVHAIP